MAAPEQRAGRAEPPQPHYGRYVGVVGLVILALITLNTFVTKPNGYAGVAPGATVPPFAVPLATGDVEGDADVATAPHQGAAGSIPACELRRPGVLNVCQLYEQGPLVLALFVNGGSCPQVLSDMQALVPAFPDVRFAAVAIRGGRGELRQLVRRRGLTFPVGFDRDGALAALYKVASCPQVTFALPGGVVQSRPLLARVAPSELRARVAALLAAARAHGWKGTS